MRTSHVLELLLCVLVLAGACDSSQSGPAGEATVLAKRCGGFAGTGCPDGFVCVSSSLAADGLGACRRACSQGDMCSDGATCQPGSSPCNDATCVYVCVPPTCGGALGLPCADGLDCIDDGTDDCEPSNAADCSGVCARP